MNSSNKEDGEALMLRIETLLREAMAAQRYDEVARLAKLADEIKMLGDQEKKIAERRKDLATLLRTASTVGSSDVEDLSAENLRPGEESPRERGARVRNHYIDFVLKSSGIQLARVSTKKYRTPTGLLVGITYASELGVRPDSWFLGLADEHYDFVILLCESAAGEIAAFVLPPQFVRRIWNALSRSNGQVKYHIARTPTAYELQLPGPRNLKINEYLSAIAALKEN